MGKEAWRAAAARCRCAPLEVATCILLVFEGQKRPFWLRFVGIEKWQIPGFCGLFLVSKKKQGVPMLLYVGTPCFVLVTKKRRK